jgi:uncharacterized protein (TIGR03435 family)
MRIALAGVVALMLAQPAPRLQFEVASVKANTRGGRTTRRIEPQGLTYLNVTLGEFIQIAYGLKHYQVVGDDWITTAAGNRYDIVAKAAAPAPEADLQQMLAPVLEDRFHLKTHRETRQLPVYVLVQAKGGAKLKEGDGGEQYAMPAAGGGFRFQNYPMAAFVNILLVMRSVGRPVIDRTGLSGRYTFTANLQDLPAGATGDDLKRAVVESDTTVFSALEDQLGLKLTPAREPIDLLIVDHADRVPTSD